MEGKRREREKDRRKRAIVFQRLKVEQGWRRISGKPQPHPLCFPRHYSSLTHDFPKTTSSASPPSWRMIWRLVYCKYYWEMAKLRFLLVMFIFTWIKDPKPDGGEGEGGGLWVWGARGRDWILKGTLWLGGDTRTVGNSKDSKSTEKLVHTWLGSKSLSFIAECHYSFSNKQWHFPLTRFVYSGGGGKISSCFPGWEGKDLDLWSTLPRGRALFWPEWRRKWK